MNKKMSFLLVSLVPVVFNTNIFGSAKTALQQVMAHTQSQMNVKNVARPEVTLQDVVASKVTSLIDSAKRNAIDAKRAFLGQNSLAEDAEEVAKKAAIVAKEAVEKAAFTDSFARYCTTVVAGLGAGHGAYKALTYFDYTNNNLGAKSKIVLAYVAGAGSSAVMYFGFDKFVAPAATCVANKAVVLAQQAGSSMCNIVAVPPTGAKVSLGLAVVAALGYGLYKSIGNHLGKRISDIARSKMC